MDGLLNFRFDRRAVGGGVLIINGSEDWALMYNAILVGDCALFDTGFESVGIPAVEEVAVEPVACTKMSDVLSLAEEERHTSRVAISEDELSTIQCDFVNAVQDFKEQMHELNGISRRACAVVDVRHVGHMAVVWQVIVDAIPARLELHLSTETVVAVCHAHVWRFGIW